MVDQNEKFAELWGRVLAGDGDAAREFHALYGTYILYAVRRKLHKRLRSKFDSLDFVQDVWASFFTDQIGRLNFRSPEDLITFLSSMARNKVLQAARARLRLQKHDVTREVSLDTMPRGGDTFPAAQSTPSEIVMSREEWRRFLSNQPALHRAIFMLLREGKCSATIAEQLSISERTVNRVLRKLVDVNPT
jgi:RNA polymerase sigma-70 factor (ECF subfamily)